MQRLGISPKPALIAILISLFVAFSAIDSRGQSNPARDNAAGPNIDGKWEGAVSNGVQKFRIIVNISKSPDGAMKASLDSPDQGAAGIPVDSVTQNDRYVLLDLKAIGAAYEGGLSRDGSEMAGQWKQGGGVPLVFKRVAQSAAPESNPPSFTHGRVKLEPCNIPSVTKDAQCGKYEVFEDRAAKTGRKIALNILLLPALAARPAPDPVFLIAGGPGQGAVSVVRALGDYFVKVRRERDIVFVDQRGAGESNPLKCDLYGNREDIRGYFIEGFSVEKVRECRAELEKVANLALYTTEIAMDDLDDVREALGYKQINLWGGSYGTKAASVYLRRYPSHVRTMLVEGFAPVGSKIGLPFAKGIEHSIDRLIDDCAADRQCYIAFPKLREELMSVLARLQKEPVTFEAKNPFTGKPQQITLTREIFVEHMRLMLYTPQTARWLPALIHAANQNNFAPFASLSAQVFGGTVDQLARGMQLSVVCAEDIPFITEDETKRETAGTIYGDYRVRTYKKVCEQWPRGKVSANYTEPFKSDAPVLIVSGDFDPVTPPWLGQEALKNFPNGKQVIIQNTGHSFRFECVDNLIAEFISKGSAKGLDDSCVKQIARPPFVTALPKGL